MNRHRALCVILLSWTALTAIRCGRNSSSGSLGPTGTPQIGVSEDTLDFGAAGLQRPLTIYNTGEGTLQWGLTSWPAWLETPGQTTGNLTAAQSQSVLLEINRSLLLPGGNASDMALNSNGGNLTITLLAQLETGAVLGELPDTLDFGSTLDSLPLAIVNAGQDTLSWNVAVADSYFSVQPSSGVTSEQSTVWVRFNREGAPVGSRQATLLISSNGGNGQVVLNAYAVTSSGLWLSYGADGDGYYIAQPADYFFVVRFDRPPEWQDFKVSRVRVLLYTLSGAYDDVQLDCWSASESGGYLFPDLYDLRYQTGNFDPGSGLNEWEVNWPLNLSTFCVGYYQPDANPPIYPDPYYNTSSPAARSYLIYEADTGGLVIDLLSEWDWCIEVFVEPQPTASGSQPLSGVWLKPRKTLASGVSSGERPAVLARLMR